MSRQPSNRPRDPISPAQNPLRFTMGEAAAWQRGECGYQTAYGLPWTEYCAKPGNKANDFGHCDEHAAQIEEEGIK